jgi:hypothetical protein
MRRLRRHTTVRALAIVLPTAVLAAPLALAPAYADPAGPAKPSSPPAVSAPAAEQALEQATALLTGTTDDLGAATSGTTDATLALLELREQLPQLSAADRKSARALMARPDGSGNTSNDTATGAMWDRAGKSTCTTSGGVLGLGGSNVPNTSSDPFCVHWVSDSSSRHYATDAAVTETVDILRQVWGTEVGSMGYRAPLSDGARGGTDNQLDVYLADTAGDGGAGYFGYAVPEDDPQASAGYLVLENDFAEFANPASTATELRQVTAAHEFFHLVQFAYDSYEGSWLMESTATWMEEQVYPDVDDNRNYIQLGSLHRPWLSLDTLNGGAEYGTWVFHELYTRSLGDGVVRRVWDYAATQLGDNARPSLNAALSEAGWNLTHAFRMFGGASLAPSLFLPEGAAYPSAALTRSWKLTRSVRSTGTRSIKLAHLGGAAYDFRPAPGLTANWKLRLKIDAPASESTAYVVVFFTNGTASQIPVWLNRYGNKTFSVPFRAGTVQRVALDLGNASGANGRTTVFRATAWR